MGMFDCVTCKYPLPVKGANALTYQTKDLVNFLDAYEIREDGTLWHEVYDTEDQSERGKWLAANPGKDRDFAMGEFAGCMTKVNKRWLQVSDFIGELRFYTMLDEPKGGWLEWSAYFENGKVVRLNQIEAEAG